MFIKLKSKKGIQKEAVVWPLFLYTGPFRNMTLVRIGNKLYNGSFPFGHFEPTASAIHGLKSP
jgi:hypothetical protein